MLHKIDYSNTYSHHIDGQKIAKKLCKGISKETGKLKKLLGEYNTVASEIESTFLPLSLEDVLSPESSIWLSPSNHRTREIPSNIQRDIIEAYLIKKRSNEELVLLKTEMSNVITYWNQRRGCIDSTLQQLLLSPANQFNRGCVSLLKQLLWEAELHHSQAKSDFSDCQLSHPFDRESFHDEDTDNSDYDSGSDYDSESS